MTGSMRTEKKIPCTDIPKRHFYAMLKKDAIGWRRTWKRAMFEVLLPSIVIWIMIIIRSKVKLEKRDSNWYLPNYSTMVSPWATPKGLGLSDGIKVPEGDYGEGVTNADMEQVIGIISDKIRLDDFKMF